MDLSKPLEHKPHDVPIAKSTAHELDEKALFYIYSYLENKKLFIKINNVSSNFKAKVSNIHRVLLWIEFYLVFLPNIFFLSSVSVQNF